MQCRAEQDALRWYKPMPIKKTTFSCDCHVIMPFWDYLIWVFYFDISEGDRNEFALRRGALHHPVLVYWTNNVLDRTYDGLLEVITTRANSFKVSVSRILVYLQFSCI